MLNAAAIFKRLAIHLRYNISHLDTFLTKIAQHRIYISCAKLISLTFFKKKNVEKTPVYIVAYVLDLTHIALSIDYPKTRSLKKMHSKGDIRFERSVQKGLQSYFSWQK